MFDIRRNRYLKAMWWDTPALPYKSTYVRRSKRDGVTSEQAVNDYGIVKAGKVGRFLPSRKWRPYSGIGIDGGYLCPLYSLREIGWRYGLTQANQQYWKRHILPEPITIVVRRGSHSHHWSKIQLVVLDEILLFLEKNGYLQFTKKFDDVIDLYLYGCDVLAKYYAEKYDEKPFKQFDKYGVSHE